MNMHELIASRRTVHDYDVRPLPEGVLERALEAALAAPNHRMTEPWRFVRVGPEARQALFEISADLKRKGGEPLAESKLAKLRDKMLRPAELVVLCQVRHPDADVAREDYAAVACAAHAAMLALWAEGVGSKWSTGAVTTDARTYARLGIDPERETIVGFFWAGYPVAGSPAPKPRRRRQLSDVLRYVP